MTYENNDRYIAEAWISNREEEEFKKSFLKSLLEQWQHHTNGFDADTVDGWHWVSGEENSIQDYIDDAVEDLLSEFYIGYTHFTNQNNTKYYFLGFEAIKLYNEDFDGPGPEDKVLPWERSQESQNELLAEEIPSLTAVFLHLYEQTYFGDVGETNFETFTKFKNVLCELKDDVDEITQALDGKIVNGLLNADSVNGIRFFIYTPEQYQRMKTEAGLYDPEDDSTNDYKKQYDKFHSIHNVFIIRTEEEIRASGYEEGVYPDNPDVAIINKYYRFRIYSKEIHDENDNVIGTEKWLQCAYDDATKADDDYTLIWRDVAKASDLIDYEKVEELLIDILNNNSNYSLNSNVVFNAIKNIEQAKWSNNVPLIKYTDGRYVYGAIYDYQSNSSYSTVPVKTIGNLKYLNLTGIIDGLQGLITQLSDEFNTFKTSVWGTDGTGGKIGQLTGSITALQQDLARIKGNQTSLTLDNIIDRIKGTEKSLYGDSINDPGVVKQVSNLQSLFNWEHWSQNNPNADFVKKVKSESGSSVSIWINKGIRLCFIRCHVKMKDSGKWKNAFTVPLPAQLQPVYPIFLETDTLSTKIRVNDDDDKENAGHIRYYTSKNATKSSPVEVVFTGFYMYSNTPINQKKYPDKNKGENIPINSFSTVLNKIN